MEQAVGRLVGALCVVTGKDEDAESAMLASWVSQVRAIPACQRKLCVLQTHMRCRMFQFCLKNDVKRWSETATL